MVEIWDGEQNMFNHINMMNYSSNLQINYVTLQDIDMEMFYAESTNGQNLQNLVLKFWNYESPAVDHHFPFAWIALLDSDPLRKESRVLRIFWCFYFKARPRELDH